MLLPKQHRLTDLIILRAHKRPLHGEMGTMLGVKDMRVKLYPAPVTSALPEFRVKQARPSGKVGTDFAGHFL